MPRKVLYFLLLLALPIFLLAGTKGRIKGKVVDMQTGEPLISANVLIVGTTNGASTDENGEYVINNVDPGVYSVRAQYLGYQTITKQEVRVNADLTAYVNFELPSDDISIGAVTVVAKKPLIKKDATSAVRITTSEDIKNLPVRGVSNIVATQAGVVDDGTVRIRGSRGDEVGYYLDGVSITNVTGGGRAISIANDAIEEVQLESGGYSAEYGGSNAGLIRTAIKTGGSKFHASYEYFTDNIGFQSAKDFYNQTKRLGTYWYGVNESSLSISGPVLSNKIKFFYNLSHRFDRSGNKNGIDGYDFGVLTDPDTKDSIRVWYPAGVRMNNKYQRFTHTASFLFDLNPITIRLSGSYTNSVADQGGSGLGDIYNDRFFQNYRNNLFTSLKVTHVLSKNMFYELSVGYTARYNHNEDQYLKENYWAYGDSVANAETGVIWTRSAKDKKLASRHGRFAGPYRPYVYGWHYSPQGRIEANHYKYKENSLIFKGDLTLLAGKHHNIKIGGEYKQYTIRSWWVGGQTSFASSLNQARLKAKADNTTFDENLEKRKILLAQGVDNYGYDIFGNETDEDGFYAPHKPVFAAFYIQDNIEYEDIILKLGLRYEYIDIDNFKLKDPTKPETGVGTSYSEGTIKADGWEDTPTFSALSPRLSVAFPVTDKTQFYAGFGQYIQQPRLSQTYTGIHRFAYEIGTGYFFDNPNGLNLRPIRKTNYSIGFRQELTDFLAIDVNGYYDDVKGQVYFIREVTDKASIYRSYMSKANGDFATTKGVEISLTMRRYQRLAVNASLSFTDARGTGSNENSNAGIVGAPVDNKTIFVPTYVAPLSHNRPVAATASIDYRFGKDDGPEILNNFGVNFLVMYSSGHPFTLGTGGRDMETSARDRLAAEPLNTSMTPSTFNVDLKIDKSFTILDNISMNVYVRVINLFDTRNVEDVYFRTGSADDDGILSNPLYGDKLIAKYGPLYKEIYKKRDLAYNGFYSSARQIYLGVRLEY